jgi:hypothetical protein
MRTRSPLASEVENPVRPAASVSKRESRSMMPRS